MTGSNTETTRSIRLIREFSKLGLHHYGNIEMATMEIVKILVVAQVHKNTELMTMILEHMSHIYPESGDGNS